MSRAFGKHRLATFFATVPLVAALACGPPTEPPPTAAELARGDYLVNRVTLCLTCHSQRDWSLYSGPLVIGAEGRGGQVALFGSEAVAPDVTPEALSGWSIAELAESLRGATLPNGERFHAGSQLESFAVLTPTDARAIAAYLKRSEPAEPETELAEAQMAAAPPAPKHSVETGEYLVTLGRCAWCHGEDLSGGIEIEIPGGRSLAPANITLDHETGVGRMNRAEFIDYFKSLDSPDFARLPVPEGELNTAMPWPWIAAMTPEDLGAIYDYLATLPVVSNQVGLHHAN